MKIDAIDESAIEEIYEMIEMIVGQRKLIQLWCHVANDEKCFYEVHVAELGDDQYNLDTFNGQNLTTLSQDFYDDLKEAQDRVTAQMFSRI